jgi:hypothetical protein
VPLLDVHLNVALGFVDVHHLKRFPNAHFKSVGVYAKKVLLVVRNN